MYGEASETLVAEHTILGEKRRRKVSEQLSRTQHSSAVLIVLDWDVTRVLRRRSVLGK